MARTDSACRIVRAPIEGVFAALVERDLLLRWLPPGGMTARFDHFDARPGGTYRLVLTYAADDSHVGKSSAGEDVVEARFVELPPFSRVVQAVEFSSDDPTFAGTMIMTWQLTATRDGTLVEIRADDVPVGISATEHLAGFESSLANLAALLED
jgi:uncharacterized protein YndB with AHSA1/START domain